MPSDPRMATESRRRTNAAYAERRLAAGWAKVMVWLSPEAVAALPALVKEHGSRDAAINEALKGAADLKRRLEAAREEGHREGFRDGTKGDVWRQYAGAAPAENPAPPASVTRGGKKTPAEPKAPVKRARVAAPSKKAASEPESGVAASVPYAGDFKRPIYQKGQTKGSRR